MINQIFHMRHNDSVDSSFAIIAVRCDDDSCTGRKNLITNKLYYFLKGYDIQDDRIIVDEWRVKLNGIYDDYNADAHKDIPHVHFSAIVGKNGSGKSTIIELLMRVINNYSTVLFGELNHAPAATRLRFIENVYASIWYECENNIYKLSVANNDVEILKYTKRNSNENIGHVVYENKQIEFSFRSKLFGGIGNFSILSKFFYTFVSNYSIYAYNTKDYKNEYICDARFNEIEGVDKEEDSKCWIHSLFHKNDGYKVPLGLSPFRKEGNIDINNEKELALERLISLMIKNEEYRRLNNHLDAVGLYFDVSKLQKYGYNAVKNILGFKHLTKDGYYRLYHMILGTWEKNIGFNFTQTRRPFYSEACEYIVYKTLKVSKQYEEHHDFYEMNEFSDVFNADSIKSLVKGEANDHSHITRKIYQTIGYLIFEVYSINGPDGNEVVFNSFEDIEKRWQLVKKEYFKVEKNMNHVKDSSLMPPPFIPSGIKLLSTESNDIVLFESLSSGERQQLFTISSILYHLDNLNSIKEDKNNLNRVFYPNINVILEEIELYFHPEMQQNFVKYLLDGIHAINLKNIKSINFIIVTHSPYVLSDIPRQNILALKSDGICSDDNLMAFGANIHDMLRSSFFLTNGAIGRFAEWTIKHIMACLEIHKWAKENNYTRFLIEDETVLNFIDSSIWSKDDEERIVIDYNSFNKENDKNKLIFLINQIDEPVVRHILTEQYENVFRKEEMTKQALREKLIQELKKLED